MKNTTKKARTICLLAAIALSGFGCSKHNTEQMPVETISLDQTKQELTFDFKTGVVNETAAPQDAVEETDDAVEGAETTEDTTVKETKKSGDSTKNVETVVEDVTQVMNVTDAEGHGVTDAAGEPATEMAVVDTRVIEVPVTDTAAESTETNAEDASEEDAAETAAAAPATEAPEVVEYKPVYDTCKAYWLDMSRAGDYTFNGEFLTFTFQLNQDIPDGSYPISITKTDIASWEEVRYYPEIINGEIAVNQTASEQKDIPSDKFSLKVNSVEAQQGQTVTVTVDLQNNPGFCGFVIDVQYDSNAMSIVEAGGGKDYDEAINVNK